MSTFADFALLASVPSYGGAEILRAQRVLPMGPGPRVHLALFGRNEAVARRVVYAANAAAAILHPAIARIYEVCRFDGVVYGVGDPAEGLDLTALLMQRKALPFDTALAITASVARVAVAVQDSGGYMQGAAGLGSVLSGGISPEGIFLEATGAVRLRPLATAGLDPNTPSPFRAPEEQISMAADVFGLGRLLQAMLTGDATCRSQPKTSQAVQQLWSRMVASSPSERPHLHEATTKLEAALREQRVASADVAVRNALAGPYRGLVVDPVLSFGAQPQIVQMLCMQLPYLYPSIEKLWPHMGGAMLPPAPPAFAALPPALPSGEGDDPGVFTDARPAVRRQAAKTAATVMFSPDDVRAAALAVSQEGAFQPKTSPTLMFDQNQLRDMVKALPAPGAPVAEDDDEFSPKTKIIEPGTFTPFAPPPTTSPSARPPPPPSIPDAPMPAPSAPPVQPPRPPTVSGIRVKTSPKMLALDDTQPKRQRAGSGVFAMGPQMMPPPPPVLSPEMPTSVAPAPLISDPDAASAQTDALPLAASDTSLGSDNDTSGAFAPIARDVRNAMLPSDAAATLYDPGDDSQEDSLDEAAPESIDDAAAFVMVGEAGQTYEGERSPLRARTRFLPDQALQQAREPDPSEDEDDAPKTELVDAASLGEELLALQAAPAPLLSQEQPDTGRRPQVPSSATQRTVRPKATSTQVAVESQTAEPRASHIDGAATSQLIVEAPDGASVIVNGKALGTGTVSVDVAPQARCIVKVTLAGHAPFSTVVQVAGKPRVRVKPVLKPRA